MKDDNNGKTGFGGNHFGEIHGNVIVQQAGHDAVLNQTHGTLNQGIQTDIENLRKLLSGLPLSGEEKSKVEKLVKTVETEAKKPVPDKEEASNALERIFKLIEKTGKLSEAIKTQLVPIGKNLGEWLGEEGKTLMAFLSAKFLGM